VQKNAPNFRNITKIKLSLNMKDNEKRKIAESVKSEVDGAKSVSVNIFSDKKIPLPPNVMVFQTFAYLAATKLKPSTCKVLMLFFAGSEYENYVTMDVLSIAETLDLGKRSVVNALNELEKQNVIIKTINPRDRRRHDYFLNPHSAWKGNSKSRKKMMQMLPTNQLSLFGIDSKEHSEREKIEIKTQLPYLQKI